MDRFDEITAEDIKQWPKMARQLMWRSLWLFVPLLLLVVVANSFMIMSAPKWTSFPVVMVVFLLNMVVYEFFKLLPMVADHRLKLSQLIPEWSRRLSAMTGINLAAYLIAMIIIGGIYSGIMILASSKWVIGFGLIYVWARHFSTVPAVINHHYTMIDPVDYAMSRTVYRRAQAFEAKHRKQLDYIPLVTTLVMFIMGPLGMLLVPYSYCREYVMLREIIEGGGNKKKVKVEKVATIPANAIWST